MEQHTAEDSASTAAPTVLHRHIPRTAGSSVSRVLNRLGSVYSFQTLSDFLKDNLSGTLGEAKSVSGHFCFGLHDYFTGPLYFVVLRDPVSHVKSLFKYIRQNNRHRLHPAIGARGFTIEEVYSRLPAEVGLQFHNGQVRQLNYFHRSGLLNMSREDLNFATSVLLRDDVIVATQENLDAGLQRLTHRLGVSREYVPITNSSKMEAVDDWDELILKHNALDLDLYRAARELDMR